jgi:hypothetical protein
VMSALPPKADIPGALKTSDQAVSGMSVSGENVKILYIRRAVYRKCDCCFETFADIEPMEDIKTRDDIFPSLQVALDSKLARFFCPVFAAKRLYISL